MHNADNIEQSRRLGHLPKLLLIDIHSLLLLLMFPTHTPCSYSFFSSLTHNPWLQLFSIDIYSSYLSNTTPFPPVLFCCVLLVTTLSSLNSISIHPTFLLYTLIPVYHSLPLSPIYTWPLSRVHFHFTQILHSYNLDSSVSILYASIYISWHVNLTISSGILSSLYLPPFRFYCTFPHLYGWTWKYQFSLQGSYESP